MCAGLRKPEELIVIVVTLLAYGCPPQAIVHAFELDERTVGRWQERAGAHCHKVHEDQILQGKLDLVHVQADEIRVKGCCMIPWMALALMVSTRLWLGGVVSLHRDRQLADALLGMVKACCRPLVTLLVLTDGWAAYPGSIRRAFREKVKSVTGRGRSRLQAWPEILIGTVIKKTVKKRVSEVIRRVRQGGAEVAMALLAASGGGTQLNTAFIERFECHLSRAPGQSHPALPPHGAQSLSAPSRHVAGWLHLQLLLAASRVEPESGEVTRSPGRGSPHTCDGQRLDRSCLERARTAHLSRPAAGMADPKAARTTTHWPTDQQGGEICAAGAPSPRTSLAKGGLMPAHQLGESYHMQTRLRSRSLLLGME